MRKCLYCEKKGEKHHIIYRRCGGLDIPINYVYLCSEHHRGRKGPHKNRKEDIRLKLMLQNKLINLLNKEYYSLKELVNIFSLNLGQTKKFKKAVKDKNGSYSRYDVIKFLIGGKFYSEYMLDEDYDEDWVCYEEDYFRLVL